MSTQTKKSLREEFLTLVKSNGWTLDESALATSGSYSRQLVQDPHVFLRPAAHGGLWQIKLDYTVRGGWSASIGDRLHKIEVRYIPAGTPTKEVTLGQSGHEVTVTRFTEYLNPLQFPGENIYVAGYSADLKNPTSGRDNDWLHEATGLDETGETWYSKSDKARTLRERAEILVKAPDLSLWVAAEAKHQAKVRSEEASQRRRADEAARAQVPAGVVVERDEWKGLLAQLNRAAGAIYNSDGKTTDIADKVLELAKIVGLLDRALGE